MTKQNICDITKNAKINHSLLVNIVFQKKKKTIANNAI